MIIERNVPGFRKIRFTHEDTPGNPSELGDDVAIISYVDKKLDGFRSVERLTPVIDLTKSLGELLKECNDTTRNEIRKGEKNEDISVNVYTYGHGKFKEAHNLYQSHESAQGRKPYPLPSFAGHFFIAAEYKSEILSCVSFLVLSDILRIRSISSKRLETDDKEIKKIVSNCSRLVMWRLIELGHASKYKLLDMAYVSGGISERLGIDAFKMGFGGTVIPDYTMTHRSPAVLKALELVSAAKAWRKKA